MGNKCDSDDICVKVVDHATLQMTRRRDVRHYYGKQNDDRARKKGNNSERVWAREGDRAN